MDSQRQHSMRFALRAILLVVTSLIGRRQFQFVILGLLVSVAAVGLAKAEIPPEITHGPMLGRFGARQMGVWIRTSRPTNFRVHYAPANDDGSAPTAFGAVSHVGSTHLLSDNTGWVLLQDLIPATKYFYEVRLENAESSRSSGGSFGTLPDRALVVDKDGNPRGLFNFSFELGSCAQQPKLAPGRTFADPLFASLVKSHAAEVDFSIQCGDWIYEEYRDYSLEDWCRQVGIQVAAVPPLIKRIPAVVGVWQNYKAYINRSPALADWHAHVPTWYMYDDHELVDDSEGAGAIGTRSRRAVFRDIGLKAWYDYLGWSNPLDDRQELIFGTAELSSTSDTLTDSAANYSDLDLAQAAELHVHWGGPNAGKKEKEWDSIGGDPNAGVYGIKRILDRNHLQLRPQPAHSGTVSYSIGRQNYFSQRIANCEFVFLDTRGHRGLTEKGNPFKKGLSILGERQKAWLKQTLQESDADCFFVVSSVAFMSPHVADVGQTTEVEDSWTGFIEERNEVLDFVTGLNKPVFLLTGDLHNSLVAQISDQAWEIMAGPHSSSNAVSASSGGLPVNGEFDSYGRKCFIRWSTWYESQFAATTVPQTTYCIVSVNNVFQSPVPEKPGRLQAYVHPQIIFKFYDGVSGRLKYAESIVLMASPANRLNSGGD